VFDAEPSEDDIAWHAALQKASIPIELYWMKGDSVVSARVTRQDFAAKAKASQP